jgi:hypothetical protein
MGQRGPMTDKGFRDVVRRYLGVSPHRLRPGHSREVDQ